MPPALDLTGKQFGLLRARSRAGKDKFGAWLWECECRCGKFVRVRGATLNAGKTKACASCARVAVNTTHGMSKTSLYIRWQAMKARTSNPNQSQYHDYGGRGIKVCDQWLASFENFAADMGPTFSPELELDRIDVNGNYEPNNCRWITPADQQLNKRNNHVLSFRGETLTVTEWARRIGAKPNTLTTRIRRGWPTERVLLELANQEV